MYTRLPAGGRIDIMQVRALTLYLAETEDGRTCFSPTDRFFTRDTAIFTSRICLPHGVFHLVFYLSPHLLKFSQV